MYGYAPSECLALIPQIGVGDSYEEISLKLIEVIWFLDLK